MKKAEGAAKGLAKAAAGGLDIAKKAMEAMLKKLGPIGGMLETVIEKGKGLLAAVAKKGGLGAIAIILISLLLKKLGVPIDAVVQGIQKMVEAITGAAIKMPIISLVSSFPGGAIVAMPVAEGVVAGVTGLVLVLFIKGICMIMQSKLIGMLLDKVTEALGKIKDFFLTKIWSHCGGDSGEEDTRTRPDTVNILQHQHDSDDVVFLSCWCPHVVD